MSIKEEEFLTPKEIEKIMKLSHGTVNKLLHSKSIPTIQIGRCIRVKASDFENFLKTYENATFNI